MKTDLKTMVIISSLAVGALVGYFGYRSFSQDVNLSEVLEYVQKHPENNEEIIDYSIKCQIKEGVPFSVSTLRAFSEAVLYQAIQNQISPGEHGLRIPKKEEITNSETGSSIINRLTPEEKWNLIQEGFFYGSKKLVNDADEISSDFYDKMKETKLYKKMEGRK